MIWCLISCKSPLSITIFITLTRYVICKCSNSVFFILRRSNVSTEIPYFPYFFCKNRKTSHIPPIFGLQKFPYFPYFFPKVWWGALLIRKSGRGDSIEEVLDAQVLIYSFTLGSGLLVTNLT